MGEVGTLCSGLPGCCCGRRQGTGVGQGAVGERIVGNPPCAGSTGGNVCMCGPSDWCACPYTAPPTHTVPPQLPMQLHVCLNHLVTGVHALHPCPLYMYSPTHPITQHLPHGSTAHSCPSSYTVPHTAPPTRSSPHTIPLHNSP